MLITAACEQHNVPEETTDPTEQPDGPQTPDTPDQPDTPDTPDAPEPPAARPEPDPVNVDEPYLVTSEIIMRFIQNVTYDERDYSYTHVTDPEYAPYGAPGEADMPPTVPVSWEAYENEGSLTLRNRVFPQNCGGQTIPNRAQKRFWGVYRPPQAPI